MFLLLFPAASKAGVLTLAIHWTHLESFKKKKKKAIPNTIPKKNKIGRLILVNFKTYAKASVIKTVFLGETVDTQISGTE